MKLVRCSEPEAIVWSNFQKMRIRLIGRINQELAAETGLSEADFVILNELIHAHDAPVRALALRDGLDWEKSRLSHQIKRMEERNLVRREPCVEDNRGSVIRLTDEGEQVALHAIERYGDIVRRHVFNRLTPEQLTALDDLSRALLTAHDESRTRSCLEELGSC